MATFNGHHCWNCWNVSLWLGNDESTYRAALEAKRDARTTAGATRRMLADLPRRTPDGARYTFKAVYAYMNELEG